ncbi:KxYKxGKxW signal peptide domain-containing protein [Lacticaseibacillus pabuli]|uniref:KxYKxGKxW signal peptide domain-containing protein n=1 Tax=Lacticaseibacillus pabuli TaxID=3025672 RepID=A0ABY7WUW0_9LACO|nr:KxYKxGKxW signal peptide domain-containing protein [Lacticaseibacillus sp. KACC 23028]WDF82839.1 KxYKxGKxW signal peptide domain-containing protein [Lacticaseibacillus sp. KACC 23028]
MENKTHAKLFKAGKNWVVALMAIATLGSVGIAGVTATMTQNVNVAASTQKTHNVTVEYWTANAKGDPDKKVGSHIYRNMADFDKILPEKNVPAGYVTANNEHGLQLIFVDPEEKYYYASEVVPISKKATPKATASQTKNYLGTVHVNYNKHYGIQIWTKEGKAVPYNSVDAKAAGKKVGTAKKLQGQSNWKVFNKYTDHGTTYYGLGGDQYIDASYVTFKAAK